jgi:CheY-like chemotaxis protein
MLRTLVETDRFLVNPLTRNGSAPDVRTAAPIRVLIIDPNAEAIEQWVRLFRERSWRVEIAPNFIQALRLLDGPHFDVVLVEMALPDMLGTEAWTFIQKMHPSVMGIITTSSPSLHRSINALGAGAAAYLLKPVDARDVFELIENLLEQQQPARQSRELQQRLFGLFNLFSAVARTNDPEQVFAKTLVHLRAVLTFDVGIAYMAGAHSKEFVHRFAENVSKRGTLRWDQLQFVEGLAQQIADSLQVGAITQAACRTRAEQLALEERGLESCYFAPIIGLRREYGVLALVNLMQDRRNDEPATLEILALVAQVAAIVLDRANAALQVEL